MSATVLRDKRLTHEELERLLAETLYLMAEMAHFVPHAAVFTERFMKLRDRVAWRS